MSFDDEVVSLLMSFSSRLEYRDVNPLCIMVFYEEGFEGNSIKRTV